MIKLLLWYKSNKYLCVAKKSLLWLTSGRKTQLPKQTPTHIFDWLCHQKARPPSRCRHKGSRVSRGARPAWSFQLELDHGNPCGIAPPPLPSKSILKLWPLLWTDHVKPADWTENLRNNSLLHVVPEKVFLVGYLEKLVRFISRSTLCTAKKWLTLQRICCNKAKLRMPIYVP